MARRLKRNEVLHAPIGWSAEGGPSYREQMTYLDQEGKVVYISKDGKSNRIFPALEWLAAIDTPLPKSSAPHNIFCAYSYVDIQDRFSYTPRKKKEFLSKKTTLNILLLLELKG